MKKKVLIITYYWPPSGGPGVQRILKFVKYLPHYNWEPIILTVKDGEYPVMDTTLLKEISPDLKVYQVRTIEFYQIFKFLTYGRKKNKIETFELIKDKKNLSFIGRIAQFVRMNLLIPDARVGWRFTGIKKGKEIIKKEKPDLIFSSSPPHSLQIIAHQLAKSSGLPWIADFRDPWTKAFYDKGIERIKISEKWNHKLENKIVANANAIVSVSQGVIDLLPTKENSITKIIPNGFDPDDFDLVKNRTKKFSITYTGYIASTQNPENLWTALASLPKKYKDIIDVNFYGPADPSVKTAIESIGITDIVKFRDYVNHDQVVQIMKDSDILVLLIPRYHSKGILTGKLFEYLASENFILGIGDPAGEAAQILARCQAGTMISYTDDPAMILKKQIDLWTDGIIHTPNKQSISNFNRKKLTGELTNLFNQFL